MSTEQQGRLVVTPSIIEITGTPIAARRKLLVHNAIEDMLAERLWEEKKESYGYYGLDEGFLPSSIDPTITAEYFRQTRRVQVLLMERSIGQRVCLIQDGAFAAMVYTEFLRRARVFSDKNAENLTRGFLPLVQTEDLITLTIIRPRAALSRELYPPQLEGYEQIRNAKFISFSGFNEALERTLDKYRGELPEVQIIKYKTDDIDPSDIVLRNADAVFAFLKLPSVDVWTEHLELHPEIRGRVTASLSGFTLAGLTREEIVAEIRARDWSKDSEKRARSQAISVAAVGALEDFLKDQN